MLAVAMAASLTSIASGAQAAVVLDFEGSSDSANPGSTAIAVEEFYNGGTDSGGTAGVNYGISFANAKFDSTSQFTQPGYAIPSAIAYMAQSPLMFTSATTFNSIAFDAFFFGAGNVINVFSGANGSGSLVATGTYGQNCFPGCSPSRQSLSFADARSVTISPNANGTGIDNLEIGAVPEASTWAMIMVGFGAIGFGMRRRKAAEPRIRLHFV
jgi:hypothetical protein